MSAHKTAFVRLALSILAAAALVILGIHVLSPISRLIPTADPVEAELTIMMFIALLTCLANIQYCRRRIQAMRKLGANGLLLVMRRGALNDQIKLAIMSGAMCAVGVVAMIQPARRRPSTWVDVVTGLLLMTTAVLIVWLSIDNRLRPFNLRRKMETEE